MVRGGCDAPRDYYFCAYRPSMRIKVEKRVDGSGQVNYAGASRWSEKSVESDCEVSAETCVRM